MKKYIFIIFIVAFALRVYKITPLPPSLNWDEVSHGYNAYSILKTSHDEWGVRLPLIFRAFGDYKLPVYIYTTVLSISLFGLNAFAIRFPSVLAGSLSIIFTYLVVDQLFKSKRLALISSLLMAIEPWSLFLSRGAFEANLALFFFISGIHFLLKGFDKKKWNLPVGISLLGLTVWTYNSYRVFTPLILLSIIIIYKNKLYVFLNKKKLVTIFSLLISIFFFVPMFIQLFSVTGQARFNWVSILDEGAIGKIIDLRNNSTLSPLTTKVLYNRPNYFAFKFTKNYLSHFSPKYLFLNGGDNYQFNVPLHGVLYILDSPFIILGFYLLIKNRKSKSSQLLLSWIIFAPIASSITKEAPHTLRSITFLPTPMILSALGINHALEKSKDILSTIIIFSITYLGLFGFYFYTYQTTYRTNYSQSWQYGYKEVVQFIKEDYSKYDKIIITKKYGEPHEFVLFYWKWDPEKFINDTNLNRFQKSNWYWVDSFDKFYFENDWNIINPKNNKRFLLESGGEVNCSSSKCLLITSPNNVPTNWRFIKTIYFLDKSPAFEIYEN